MATERDTQTYTVRVSDPMLQNLLEDSENKSELFREGAKRLAWERKQLEIPTPDLDEDERDAYAWLVDYCGEGTVRMDVARTKLAQMLQVDRGLVKTTILVPLQRKGYLHVITGLHEVSLDPVLPREVADGQ